MKSDIATFLIIVTALFFILLVIGIIRVIRSGTNDLEWSHLISDRGIDRRQWTSWKKIGEGGGVILCIWLPLVYVYSEDMEASGLALIMTVALGYLFGGAAYAATLRSRQGSIETVTSTTVSPVMTSTETVTETHPIEKG